MLAIQQNFGYKRQSRRNVGFLTASNQNEGLTRMTEFSYTSIIWLTQGKYAIVDNEDYEWLSQWKWHFGDRYAKRTKGGQKIMMHRVIANTPSGMFTDHINRIKTDNRKVNLRMCGHAENLRNQGLRADNISGFKGVCWSERDNKWLVQLRFNGKRAFQKLYESPIEAAKAYDKAVIKYFGEYATTNKMLGRV